MQFWRGVWNLVWMRTSPQIHTHKWVIPWMGFDRIKAKGWKLYWHTYCLLTVLLHLCLSTHTQSSIYIIIIALTGFIAFKQSVFCSSTFFVLCMCIYLRPWEMKSLFVCVCVWTNMITNARMLHDGHSI